MFFQISVLVLLENLQGAIPLSAQLLQFGDLQNFNGAPTARIQDNSPSFWTISLTSPLSRYSAKQLETNEEDISRHDKQLQVGEGAHPRIRREVPDTSYGRPGSDGDGLEVALPGGEDHPAHDQDTSNRLPDRDEFKDDGSFNTTFQTNNGIKSTTSDYQKVLPSGERGQAMQGQYSYTAPDGSTVNTRWTADEKGFRVHGPHISIVFTFVIATDLAAPQVVNPSVAHSIQPLAYAAPTPYQAQYQTGYNHVGYSAPAYKPYSPFAPTPVTAVKPYAAFVAAPLAPIAPLNFYATPALPAIQPYHAYHQYAGQPQHQ